MWTSVGSIMNDAIDALASYRCSMHSITKQSMLEQTNHTGISGWQTHCLLHFTSPHYRVLCNRMTQCGARRCLSLVSGHWRANKHKQTSAVDSSQPRGRGDNQSPQTNVDHLCGDICEAGIGASFITSMLLKAVIDCLGQIFLGFDPTLGKPQFYQYENEFGSLLNYTMAIQVFT